MKKELKNFLVGISVVLFYLLSSYLGLFILKIFNINPNNFNMIQKIIYNLVFEIILLSIIIFIYRKDIIHDFKHFKKCHFSKYIRFWFIALGLMMISSIVINMFTNISTSTNQEIVEDTFYKAPIFTTILTILFAPILEELVFRLSFRKMFKTDKLFIIFSGIFFGFLHVSQPNSFLELLYIIPYSIPGCIFAYTLVKSKNIFVPIGLHMMHNTLMIILQFLTMK